MTEDDDRQPALRRPALIELDENTAADPATAPPVPEDLPQGRAMLAAARVAQARPSPLMRFALWSFSALFTFVLAVAAHDFIADLMARNPVLGSIALALTGLAVAMALLLAGREWAAFLRLSRLDGLRQNALAARQAQDLRAAKAVADGVAGLYAHRPEAAEARQRLAARRGELLDADALIDLAEREFLLLLDAQARREIEGAARQVATVTALVPLALADVAAALFANLRMIRRIAEIYGGRSGGFASVGLLRRVFTYLVATGAVALTDDLIGSVAGGGLLSKVSRRFGEGVVNGALTARIGLAAMELSRPLPFHALPRPKVTNLVSRALTGLFDRSEHRDGA